MARSSRKAAAAAALACVFLADAAEAAVVRCTAPENYELYWKLDPSGPKMTASFWRLGKWDPDICARNDVACEALPAAYLITFVGTEGDLSFWRERWEINRQTGAFTMRSWSRANQQIADQQRFGTCAPSAEPAAPAAIF